MKVIIAIDKNNGVMFASRRQSQDNELRKYLIALTKNDKLFMSQYSAKQFANNDNANIIIDNDCLNNATQNDYCFVEGQDLKDYQNDIDSIIVCKWNRSYPISITLDIDYKQDRKMVNSTNIVGKSHKKITIEEWIK